MTKHKKPGTPDILRTAMSKTDLTPHCTMRMFDLHNEHPYGSAIASGLQTIKRQNDNAARPSKSSLKPGNSLTR